MTMNFEAARNAFVTLLGNAQGTNWRTIGYAERDQSAKENRKIPTVQVYYNAGKFPKSRSSMVGPIYHEMDFRLWITVAAAAKGDITALDDAESEAEYMAAVATFTAAEFEADRLMDEMIRRLWQLVMNAANQDLGLSSDYPLVSNRWIDSVRKEEPKRISSLVTMRAMMTVKAQISEEIIGIDTTGLIEYDDPPYSGEDTIKGNTPQSGVLSAGEPVSHEI
jgi:hypothetical protein